MASALDQARRRKKLVSKPGGTENDCVSKSVTERRAATGAARCPGVGPRDSQERCGPLDHPAETRRSSVFRPRDRGLQLSLCPAQAGTRSSWGFPRPRGPGTAPAAPAAFVCRRGGRAGPAGGAVTPPPPPPRQEPCRGLREDGIAEGRAQAAPSGASLPGPGGATGTRPVHRGEEQGARPRGPGKRARARARQAGPPPPPPRRPITAPPQPRESAAPKPRESSAPRPAPRLKGAWPRRGARRVRPLGGALRGARRACGRGDSAERSGDT
ncbi:translation initiation factor IF-2-like [Oenanthe melanoleuca]|uniref:translation initiation factor IF-2-like n=1 Tax=Oenanthe melanoleuca TaxID=2939378 RepID=UPI0024C1E844|nr:translation initiation factor IF-2-like [Oenanthe melanoleuca]